MMSGEATEEEAPTVGLVHTQPGLVEGHVLIFLHA
jgi:hypothetical protein